jgi:hypothetical protein
MQPLFLPTLPAPASPLSTIPTKNLKILWITRSKKSKNLYILPLGFDLKDKHLKYMVGTKNNERFIEEYNAVACLLRNRGFAIKFMPMGLLIAFLKSSCEFDFSCDYIFTGNWPYKTDKPSVMLQQLEDLCIHGVQCIPKPADVLFAAQKHRYMNYLQKCGVPFIPTVFASADTKDWEYAIENLQDKIGHQLD